MKINFKKLSESAKTPFRAHATDAGFDLFATDYSVEGDKVVYKTGIAMEIPEGHVGLIFPRSSIAKKDVFMTNSVGVIDSGYRGEIMFKFRKLGDEIYNVGDRIGQIIIMPIPEIEFNEVESLNESDRGEGGFGSSGK